MTDVKDCGCHDPLVFGHRCADYPQSRLAKAIMAGPSEPWERRQLISVEVIW
jgi:hypothetical protein